MYGCVSSEPERPSVRARGSNGAPSQRRGPRPCALARGGTGTRTEGLDDANGGASDARKVLGRRGHRRSVEVAAAVPPAKPESTQEPQPGRIAVATIWDVQAAQPQPTVADEREEACCEHCVSWPSMAPVVEEPRHRYPCEKKASAPLRHKGCGLESRVHAQLPRAAENVRDWIFSRASGSPGNQSFSSSCRYRETM